MSNRNPRNLQLLSQISDLNPFKKTIAPRVFDIGHDMERDVEAIFARDATGQSLRRDLSPEGKRDEALKAARRAIRDLRDIKKPLEEYHAKTETMRAEATLPAYDKGGYASRLRRELRDRSFAMTVGQRAGLLTGPNRSTEFIDALLELPAWASGIDIYSPDQLEIYKIAKEERLRDLYGPLLDTVADREGVEKETMMILNVVRGDIQNDSGLESRDFEAFAKPIESKARAPWVMEDGKTICEVVNGKPEYHQGSPDELRDAVKYPNPESFLASRAA
jgi:hypothetical protein